MLIKHLSDSVMFHVKVSDNKGLNTSGNDNFNDDNLCDSNIYKLKMNML